MAANNRRNIFSDDDDEYTSGFENFVKGVSGFVNPIADAWGEISQRRREEVAQEAQREAKNNFIRGIASKPYLDPSDFADAASMGMSAGEVSSINKSQRDRPLADEFTAAPGSPQGNGQNDLFGLGSTGASTQEDIARQIAALESTPGGVREEQAIDQLKSMGALPQQRPAPDPFSSAMSDYSPVVKNLYKQREKLLRSPPSSGKTRVLDQINTALNSNLRKNEKELNDYKNSVVGAYGGEDNLQRQVSDENKAIRIVLGRDKLSTSDTKQIQSLSSVHAKNSQSIAHKTIASLGSRSGMFAPSARSEANKGGVGPLFDEHVSSTERALKASILNYISDSDSTFGGPQGNYSRRVNALLNSAFTGDAPPDFLERTSGQIKDYLDAEVSRNTYLARRGSKEALEDLNKVRKKLEAFEKGQKPKSAKDSAMFAYNEASKAYPDVVDSMIGAAKELDIPDAQKGKILDILKKEKDVSTQVASDGGAIASPLATSYGEDFADSGADITMDMLAPLGDKESEDNLFREISEQVALDATIGATVGAMGGPGGVAAGAAASVLAGLVNLSARKGAKLAGPSIDRLAERLGYDTNGWFEQNAEAAVSAFQLRNVLKATVKAAASPASTLRSAQKGFNTFKSAMASVRKSKATNKTFQSVKEGAKKAVESANRKSGDSLSKMGRKMIEETEKSGAQTKSYKRFYESKDGLPRDFFRSSKEVISKNNKLFQEVPEKSINSTHSMLDSFENTGNLWRYVDSEKYLNRATELNEHVYSAVRKSYGADPAVVGAVSRIKESVGGRSNVTSTKRLMDAFDVSKDDVDLAEKLSKQLRSLEGKKGVKVDGLLDAKATVSSLRRKIKDPNGVAAINKLNDAINKEISASIPSQSAKELETANKTMSMLYNAAAVTKEDGIKSAGETLGRMPVGEAGIFNSLINAVKKGARGQLKRDFLKKFANSSASGNPVAKNGLLKKVVDLYSMTPSGGALGGAGQTLVLGRNSYEQLIAIKKIMQNKKKSEEEKKREVESVVGRKL